MAIDVIENEQAVRDALKLACFHAGGQNKFADLHNLSAVVISDMIRGKRTISRRIAAIVGFERVTTFRRVRKSK